MLLGLSLIFRTFFIDRNDHLQSTTRSLRNLGLIGNILANQPFFFLLFCFPTFISFLIFIFIPIPLRVKVPLKLHRLKHLSCSFPKIYISNSN